MFTTMRRLSPKFVPLMLFVVIAGFYAATFSFRHVTDTNLNSLQTRSLVVHGNVDLSRYGTHVPKGYVVQRGPHRYAIYGVGISLASSPVYLALARTHASDALLQGAVAVAYCAGAVIVLFLALTHFVSRRVAVAGALLFAFGTTVWPVASMALYQQGPVMFFEALGTLALFRRRGRDPVLAGAAFGVASLIRPTALIGLAVVAVVYLIENRRRLAGYILGAAAPLAALLIQNRWIWGGWLKDGYSYGGVGFAASDPRTLYEMLFGWWRGMFVYSPVLIIAIAGAVVAVRHAKGSSERRLVALGVVVAATFVLYAKRTEWYGGINQFGYRYPLDVMPFIVALTAFGIDRLKAMRRPAVILGTVSVLTMTMGAITNRFSLDGVMFAKTPGDASIGQAWVLFGKFPVQSITRLLFVAVVAWMFLLVADRAGATETWLRIRPARRGRVITLPPEAARSVEPLGQPAPVSDVAPAAGRADEIVS